MGNLATLSATVVADSSSFTAGMVETQESVVQTAEVVEKSSKRMNTAMATTGAGVRGQMGTMQNVADKMQQRLGGAFGLAGAAAVRFGGLMRQGVGMATKEMGAMGPAAAGVGDALTSLAMSGSQAVGLMGRLSTRFSALGKMNFAQMLGIMGLAQAAGALGYAIGTLINKYGGLQEIMADKVVSAWREQAVILANNSEAFNANFTALERMKKTLKLTGPEWDLFSGNADAASKVLYALATGADLDSAALKKEGISAVDLSTRLLQLIDNVRGIRDAKKEAKKETDEYTKKIIALGKAYGEQEDKRKKMIADLKETYGVFSKKDVLDNANKLVDDIKKMSEAGVPAAVIMRGVGEKVADITKNAGEAGVELPAMFQKVKDAVDEKDPFYLAQTIMTIRYGLPKATQEGTEESARRLKEMGDALAGAVSGGFGKAKEEVAKVGKEIDAVGEKKPKVVVEVDADFTRFREKCKTHGVNLDMGVN